MAAGDNGRRGARRVIRADRRDGDDAGSAQGTRSGARERCRCSSSACIVAGDDRARDGASAAAGAGRQRRSRTSRSPPTTSTIKQKGKSDFVAAKDGQALKQGDTIKTDAAGRAEIDYTDGSLTRLGGLDRLHHLQAHRRAGGRQTQGTLSVGETWNRAAKVSETGSFEVKAGGTTAAVEGTAFVVKCVPQDRRRRRRSTCTVTAVVDDIKVDSDAWDVTSVTDTP